MFSCQLVEILEYKVRRSIKQYKYSTLLYPKTFYLFKQHIMLNLIWVYDNTPFNFLFFPLPWKRTPSLSIG